MSDDKQPLLAEEEVVMSRNELTDEDIDEIDRLLMRAMSRAALESVGEDAAASPGMSTADREALAALGSSEEFASRVAARARGKRLSSPAAGSTFMAANALVSTVPARESNAGQDDASPDDVEREALLARHRACRRKRRFAWNYEFVKDEQPIGHGGQGTVYLAHCLDSFVGQRAIKVYSPEPYPSKKAYVADMKRLRSVASAVQETYHDNLIYVDNVDSHGGIYVMIMRLVNGFDLRRLTQPDVVEKLRQSVSEKRWRELRDFVYAESGGGFWGLAPGFAVNIIEKLLRALRVLHRKNIVHCDLKPSNVMIDHHGSVRLIDLGSAFHLDAPPQQHAWTPWYAPPEVLEGGKWTKQGDQASLGYMLIELVSGRPDLMWPIANTDSVYTLDDNTRSELIRAKRLLPSRLKELLPIKAQRSELLMTLCQILIDPDPAARFESAGEAINRTADFNRQLIKADLAVPWVWEIERWIKDVKDSMHTAEGES